MKKAYQVICKIEAAVAKTTLVAMVLLIFTSAIARAAGYPLNWAIDISTFLFAWSCFLSADVAWREGKLMGIDLILKRLPEKARRIIKFANYIILACFLLYLIVFGCWLSYSTWARAFQGIPGFSYTWVTLSVPVGSIMLLTSTIFKVKEEFIANKKEPGKTPL